MSPESIPNSDHSSDDGIVVKRRRFLLTPSPPTITITTETDTILDEPLSQLSISQGDRKRKKVVTSTTMISNDKSMDKNHQLPTNSLQNCKPRYYLNVSDRIFKQMLSNSIDNGHKLVQCLDNKEKLQFIRQMTEITHDLYFKNLQRQLWQEYYNRSLEDADNWESKVTKQYAHQHNACQMYKPRKASIKQRQATIAQEITQKEKELHEYLLNLQQCTKKWEPSIDPDSLSHAINECVRKGQQRLKENFNYKKEMIKLDWNDHQLLRKFYQLTPDEEQIELAKKIWQATSDELQTKEKVEILRQRIFLKRLPAKTDQMINQLLDDNKETLSKSSLIDEKQCTSIASRCSKAIVQCKFNLMLIQIDELEAVIRHHHATLIRLQEQLSKLNREKPFLYTIVLLDTIEERRQAMIQRFFRMRQQTLKTFFDEAPTVVNNNL